MVSKEIERAKETQKDEALRNDRTILKFFNSFRNVFLRGCPSGLRGWSQEPLA